MPDLVRFDPAATQRRYDALALYMQTKVLSADGFCCAHEQDCRSSLRLGDAFAAGQLSHVGRHYDLSLAGRPFRILVLGMDTGRPDGGVGLERRREQIYARIPEALSRRNPHMRGTSLALRVLLERERWEDPSQERFVGPDGEPVHLLDAYSMANSRLCSAFRPPSTKSHGTARMSSNCLGHLRVTLEILEPQVIVIQSIAVRRAVQALFAITDRVSPNLELAELEGDRVVVAAFAHPSYPGPRFDWSRPSAPYFQGVVLPTLREARSRALEL